MIRYVIDAAILLLALVGCFELALFIAAPFLPPSIDYDEEDERLI